MRRFFTLLAIIILFAVRLGLADDASSSIGLKFNTTAYNPQIWLCEQAILIDDDLVPGRVDEEYVCSQKDEFEDFDEMICDPECCIEYNNSECIDWTGCFLKGKNLTERDNGYAFEGEKIEWKVLVMDKNKIEQIKDVVVIIGSEHEEGNLTEAECIELQGYGEYVGILPACEADVDKFDNQMVAYYECTFTVEPFYNNTQLGMHGEHWITVEAVDTTGLRASIDEREYLFFNPVVSLGVDGGGDMLDFGTVDPGTEATSGSVIVTNAAEDGSGVRLDMFISGTDFYDNTPGGSGARCSLMNRLKLGDNYAATGKDSNNNKCEIGFSDTGDHLCYRVVKGSTWNDSRSDAEGYAPIVYGETFTRDFYNDAEVIQADPMGVYWGANILAPGSEMTLTFKLGLPVPCIGDFTDGDIFFWGEAI